MKYLIVGGVAGGASTAAVCVGSMRVLKLLCSREVIISLMPIAVYLIISER